MKRYVLHPGYIRSAGDGVLQFIDATQLAQLYRVPLSACLVSPYHRPVNDWDRGSTLIHLYPRDDGQYPAMVSLSPAEAPQGRADQGDPLLGFGSPGSMMDMDTATGRPD